MFVYSTCIVFVLLFVPLIAAFPENLIPINTYDHLPSHVFAGKGNENDERGLYVQIMKTLKFGRTTRVVIAGRENLFLLDPGMNQDIATNGTVEYTEAYSWNSDKDAKEICQMKGQSQEQCHNYLSVLEMSGRGEMLICGTNAFDPLCRKYKVSVSDNNVVVKFNGEEMTGRQRSPFGPSMPTANLFSDGSLFSATYESFYGGMSVVSRTLGKAPALRRSDTSTDSIMNEPDFVKMTEDNERILIFFNENEVLSTGEKRTIPQVAQLCKNDVGGQRILSGSFTTFIKTRLNCSYNGFYLDEIRDLTDPIPINNEFVIFATFATPENSLAGTALCSFALSSVYDAMNGPFHPNPKVSSRIARAPPPPSRHPGSCPSEKLSDEELLYVKYHPQMQKQVSGSLLLTNQGNRWTAIHAGRLSSSNNLTLLLIGTEKGHLIRALSPTENWPQGMIISDADVFDENKCLSNKKDDAERHVKKILVENNTIFVAFKHCVITTSLKWCSNHQCESECNGAADPFCSWNGSSCTPQANPRTILKENLNSESRTPCPNKESGENAALMGDKADNELQETPDKNILNVTNPFQPVSPAETKREKPSESLVFVAVVASASTFVLTIIFMIICYCCRKRRKQTETLKDKQSAEIHHMATHGNEKRNSFSRLAQQTYRSWKGLITKATTPIQSPELRSKSSQRRERRENVYTAPPKLTQEEIERGKLKRSSKTRLDSTSTSSSRQDSVNRNPSTKPLLPSPTADTDITLPRSIANASTLRHSPNRPITSASSPTRTSGTSFVANNEYREMPDGSVSSHSAKLRRSANARQQANEIMRDSGSANGLRGIEAALVHMQEQGSIPPPDMQNDQNERQRLASDDSGKGESPRNSCQSEMEKAEAARQAKMQRPMSLNVQRSSPSKRTRLLSEGARPYSDQSSLIVMAPRLTRERHSSGQNSIPTTPVNGPQRLSVCQASNNRVLPEEYVMLYGTGPRNEHSNAFCYPAPNPYEKTMPLQAVHHVPPAQFIPQVPFQRPPNMQRQISEPQNRAQVGRSLSTSIKIPPNYYPSLQERALPPHEPVYLPQEQQRRPEPSGPKNHYPSLPHRSSTAPYGDNNSYISGNGFERPATLHKREQIPSLIRQASTPNASRGVYVPPPAVPNVVV